MRGGKQGTCQCKLHCFKHASHSYCNDMLIYGGNTRVKNDPYLAHLCGFAVIEIKILSVFQNF